MCGGRSSILHYGPLIETNNLYAPTPTGQKSECVAKQKQYPLTKGYISNFTIYSKLHNKVTIYINHHVFSNSSVYMYF